MPYADVTRLVYDVDPFDLSASVAERGKNAGPETWANALACAGDAPLTVEDREGAKRFFRGFGAWDREEIEAWSDAELDALILQMAAGDLRELQSLCPGDGLGDVDWKEAETLMQEGTVSARLFVIPASEQGEHGELLMLDMND